MGYIYECIPVIKSGTKGHVKQYRQSLYWNVVALCMDIMYFPEELIQ